MREGKYVERKGKRRLEGRRAGWQKIRASEKKRTIKMQLVVY